LPLNDYLLIVRRHGWVIVLTAVVGAIAALLFSLVQRPVYQSTIRLNVIGMRPDLGLSQTLKGLLRNYAGQIKSYDTATLALRDMKEPLDLTPDGLLAKINVQAVEADLQLVIEAEDHDPHIAQMIADQMASTFVWSIKQFNESLDVRDRVNVFTSGPASPAVKVRPQKKLNTAAGGILGAVLGLLIVMFLEWQDSHFVRRESDIARDAGVPLLGSVQIVGHDPPEPGGRAWSGQAVPWVIPLAGGVALGALLASAIYLWL
jgi:non-specific protein-tyrosine kinase